VAEIRCLGEAFGSGYLLSPSLVLTAAHVVGELGSELPAEKAFEVTLLNSKARQARLVWPLRENWIPFSKHDLALLEIEPDHDSRARGRPVLIGWDRLRTDQPLEITAAGFPRLRRNPNTQIRETEQIFGSVSPLSAVKAREFEINDTKHSSVDADWRGFSGAALFAGDFLIGVVKTRVTDGKGIDFKAVRIDSPDEESFYRLIRHARKAVTNLGMAQTLRRKTKNFYDEYLVSESGAVPFGGRDTELKYLDGWLADPTAAPRMLITAPGGRGKSALLVQWVKSLLDRDATISDDWQIAFTPISIRIETNRSNVFLGALAYRLSEITGESIPPESAENADILGNVVHDQLELATSLGQRLLIVFDGLDEALHGSFDASVIPTKLPPNIRVVLSARWQVGDTSSNGWQKRLGWDRGVRVETLELQPLTSEAIADVLLKLGAPTDLLARDRSIISRLSELTEGEPLLVRFFAEDLWLLSKDKVRISTADLDTLKPGFSSYFERWLLYQERLWRDEGQILGKVEVDRILSILAFALGPLQAHDLLDLMKEIHEADDLLSEHALLQPLRRFVIGDGKAGSGYVLSHPKIADHLRNDRFEGRSLDFRAGFARWGQKHLRSLNSGSRGPKNASRYALQFLKDHFADAELAPSEWMELVENGWREAWELFDSTLRGFTIDVQTAWNAIRCRGSLDSTLGMQWRCALVLSSIRSIGKNTPDTLIYAAVSHGFLSVRQAIQFAEAGRSDIDAVRLLLSLLELKSLDSDQSRELSSIALERARMCRSPWDRAQALRALAPTLPPEQRADAIAEAFAAANAINGACDRALTLAMLSRYLSPENQGSIVSQALAAAKTHDNDEVRGRALELIAPYLSAEQAVEALRSTKSMGGDWSRARALRALAPYLPPDQLTTVIDDVRAIVDKPARVYAFAILATHLPREQKTKILTEALDVTKTLDEDWARSNALEAMAPNFRSFEEATDALTIAAAIEEERYRAKALAALAPFLSTQQKTTTLAGLFADRYLCTGRNRSEELESLIPHLSRAQLDEALAAVRTIGFDFNRVPALQALAPYLSREKIPEALAIAKEICDSQDCASALIALSQHQLGEQRTRTLTEALDAVAAIRDEQNRLSSLKFHCEHFLPSHAARALAVAKGMSNEPHRALALGRLAGHLSPNQIVEALTTAKELGDPKWRTNSLLALAPHLPLGQKTEILAEALAAAGTIATPSEQVSALTELVPHLLAEQKAEALAEALCIAKAIRNPYLRSVALGGLVQYLPQHEKSEVLYRLLNAVFAISSDIHFETQLSHFASLLSPGQVLRLFAVTKTVQPPKKRAIATRILVPYLPADERAEALSEVLAITETIEDESDRASELGKLASLLSPEQVSQALIVARAIQADWYRMLALMRLAQHLLPLQKAEVLAEALDCAERVEENERSRALGLLAEYLLPEQFTRAFAIGNALADESNRASALEFLAPHMPPEQLTKALGVARAMVSDWSRADALGSLAPRVLPTQYEELLDSLIEAVARLHRPRALEAISRSVHISAALGRVEGLEQIRRAISDTARWYP
jgi:hypothetical protein